ncbi:GMC oxidoreductase [Streptomyces sp. NPDC088775]|uniref:GMC oxidoreductase n=1 Tax=Streptomyces sp. NPDC088775 TaxID=3365896 RepID=UPI0037FBC4D3
MVTGDREIRSYDAVIVGSGFAGAWAAKELTEAGFHTLLLEAGPPRSADEIPERFHSETDSESGVRVIRRDTYPSRLDSGNRTRHVDVAEQVWKNQPVQRQHGAFLPYGPHLFVDDMQHPYETPEGKPYFWIRGMQIGGRSLTWGGSALRLSAYELDAPELDGCALGWPVQYEELARAYAAVEEVMGLRGTVEELPRIPDSVYRYGPHDLTPAERDFQKAYTKSETRPIPVRFIPPGDKKVDWPGFTMQATALAAAYRTGRLKLQSHALVSEVTFDQGTGNASGVRYVDTENGSWHNVKARVVFLCCGTIETTRLMLNSRSRSHPDGLGNSSGLVGCGLMDHPVIRASGALASYPIASGFDPPSRQRGLLLPFQPDGRDDVRPFGMWVTLQRTASAEGIPLGYIDAQGEMLPYGHNRVTLSNERDRWGIPIPVIECEYGAHEQRLYGEMRRAIEQVAETMGLQITDISDALSKPGLNVHDLGTVRMGSNSSISVLDPQNRCWDCKNVFVTDGSCFPSAGWQNPTLTIMALSLRAGRYAVKLLRNGTY